jgi:uncharacterized membrane protein
MEIRLPALLTILGMAVVTYLTRISGLWLVSHVTLSPRMKAWLDYLPGSVIVAIVAPVVLSTGPAESGAALVTALVMVRTRNLLLAMIAGVGVVWGLRLLQANLP